MIMLQVPTDPLNNATSVISTGHNFWFYFEVVLIICVIIYQFIHSRKVFLSIEELKGIFNNRIIIKNGFIEKTNLRKKDKSLEDIVFIEEGDENADDLFSDQKIVNISIADTKGKGIIKRICDDINNYLLNNYGATVNFSMIKDIVDREVDIKDEEISHSIPTPLYLGLAATMIGIIFGLFSMPELNGDHFSKGIDALINGVKLAMFGSLSGLACTTILSSFFYKNAKKQVLSEKNKQISYLQAMLLPELLKAEESGISGLKASIDRFARDTTGMATILYNTTLKTESNLKIQNEIIVTQKEIIQKIESIGVTRVSKANLELLEKLEKNIQSFNQFANYLELMGRISVQLQDFASRTANIDSITRHIESSLSENKRLIEFLSSHFNKIENAGNAARNAVDVADSHFRDSIERLKLNTESTLENLYKSITESSSKFAEAIDNLNTEIQTRTEKINQNAADHESKLSEIYNEIGFKLKTITDEHIGQLNSSFKEAVPRFDELKHLNELPVIREQFTNNHNSRKFIEVVEGLNESVLKVKENINQHNLLSKLSSIEDALKRKKPDQSKQTSEPKESYKPIVEEKPVSIFEAITKLFKK
ncbi:hypothetical protein DSECCO2_351420 [anaerobic digester metagenome]